MAKKDQLSSYGGRDEIGGYYQGTSSDHRAIHEEASRHHQQSGGAQYNERSGSGLYAFAIVLTAAGVGAAALGGAYAARQELSASQEHAPGVTGPAVAGETVGNTPVNSLEISGPLDGLVQISAAF